MLMQMAFMEMTCDHCFRWHFEMPSIMEGSVLIMSKAGTGMAMFSMGR